jgi:hypothetical protein
LNLFNASIAARIIHRIMRVPGDSVLLPFAGFVCVLHQPGIEIAYSPPGKVEGVLAQAPMKVVINELPIERHIV